MTCKPGVFVRVSTGLGRGVRRVLAGLACGQRERRACERWAVSSLLLVSLAVFSPVAGAADGDYIWAKQMGGSGRERGSSVAVDSSGNVYTTGYFAGTVDFDPGAGTANLTAVGLDDIFVSKLDSSGAFVWAKQMGGSGNEVGVSVAVDSSGNVYVTGTFSGTVDFDPGAGTANLTSAGYDIFVSKLDTSGAFMWAKQMGGTSGEEGFSVAVDSSGNVYTTGYFEGTVDFDPDAGTANLTAVSDDIFVSKLDTSGAFVWAKQMGGSSEEYGLSVAVDSSGNVYTTGWFYGTVDFDPGAGTANLTAVGITADIFVSKLDTSGAFVWARQMGSVSYEYGYSVAVDSSGNVYTTGQFTGTLDFDPGAGTANLTTAGSYDIFVSKLDSSGAFVWAKQMGGSSGEYGSCVAVDSSGNVYTTGDFGGTGDFDPGAGTANLTAVGSDIFVSKLDTSGAFVWAKQMGGSGSGNKHGKSVAVDSSGGVYATGYFGGTGDFDPGPGTANLTAVGSDDIFVSKLSGPPPPEVWADFAWTGTESGTQGEPYNTLAEAISAVAASGTAKIKGDTGGSTTSETQTITKAVRIEAIGGLVRIGVLGGGGSPPLGTSATGAGLESSGADRKRLLELFEVAQWALAGRTAGSGATDEGAVRTGTTYEPVLPYTQAAGGAQAAQADSVLAVRLRVGADIDPNSIWAPLVSAAKGAPVEWQPVQDGDMRDLWVIVKPEETWLLEDLVDVTAGARTADGEAAGPVAYEFQIESEEEAQARGAQSAAPLWQPQPNVDFNAAGVDAPAASSAATVTQDAMAAVPPVENGVESPLAIGPERVYETPQRVWLPLPSGVDPSEVRVYYYHPNGSDRGWYPAESVEGWLVPGSYLSLEVNGTSYLGFLVRHAGIVQLGR